LPPELTRGPFTVAEARRLGLARWHLEGASWRRLAPGVYAWAALADTPALRLEAARLRMPASATFSGKTAAWLHGVDATACEPIEAILPGDGEGWERGGIRVRRAAMDDCDVVAVRGFRTTSIERTIWDLTRSLSLVEAVVTTDIALHAGLIRRSELREWIDRRAGQKGVEIARRVLKLAESASESPMETRLRLLLVLNGLPKPEVQVTIRDERGSFLGRPDLYYPECRIGLEYDGETHRSNLVEDNRRQNRLLVAGVRLLRFTGADVLRRPASVVTQVRSALAEARSKPAFHSPMRALRGNQSRIGLSDAGFGA
jgi:very-short-patch-repair endonuclease